VERRRCFFCGESNPIVLEEHHIVPRAAAEFIDVDPEDLEITVTLCANCHKKLHYILRPLMKLLKIEVKEYAKVKAEELAELGTLRWLLENALKIFEELARANEMRLVNHDVFRDTLVLRLNISAEKAEEVIHRLKTEGVLYTPMPKMLRRA